MAIRDIPEEDSNGCRATSTRVSSSRAIKGYQGPSRAITCRATSAVCTARVSGEHQSACDEEGWRRGEHWPSSANGLQIGNVPVPRRATERPQPPTATTRRSSL